MHPNALTLSCAAAISADETWRVIALIRGKGKQPRAQSLTWMHGWAMLHKQASVMLCAQSWGIPSARWQICNRLSANAQRHSGLHYVQLIALGIPEIYNQAWNIEIFGKCENRIIPVN